MSEIFIDWSKAPEGTTQVWGCHDFDFVGGVPNESSCWEKVENGYTYQWRHDHWDLLKLEIVTDNQIQRIQRPQPSSNQCKTKVLRKGAIIPTRATAKAVGYDVCFCPTMEDLRQRELTYSEIKIHPGDVMRFGTGLAFEIPEHLAMLVLPRSGMANNKRLRPANTPGLIDSDYRGELFIGLENFGDRPKEIEPGMAIAQIVFIEPKFVDFLQVDVLSETERGEGGFGHTGDLRGEKS